MSLKRRGDLPPGREAPLFKGEPLLEASSGLRERLAAAKEDQEKIGIIRGLKDPAAVPLLAGVYTDGSSSDALSEAAYEAIRGMGASAVPGLKALSAKWMDGFVKTCLDELICEISIDGLQKRLGEAGSVRDAVETFAGIPAGSHLVDRLREAIVLEAGLSAVPELILVADAHEDPVTADCAMVFISDIAHENPGRPELLRAVPMLERQIKALEDVEVEPETIGLIRSGPSEAAAKSLLLLRTVHPRFSVVSNAIDLLRELAEQNPGNDDISSCVFALIEKLGTKDPVLNRLIYKTIREIGGINPPLTKTDKSEN